MENRKGTPSASRKRPALSLLLFYFLFSTFAFSSVAGCGAPGEPVPPIPPVPEAVTDLTAKQSGDGVQLTFTMPAKSTLGSKLEQTPTFEVMRGAPRADGTPDPKSFRVVDTVPGALASRYVQHGQIVFLDPVAPSDPQVRAGQPLVYHLRTLISEKHPSPNSADVAVHIYPVAEAISTLTATVTEHGIELKWAPPTRMSSGEALAAIKEYHVYRGEPNPPAPDQPASNSSQSPWKSPLLQLSATTSPEYRDSGFDYGKTYVYMVRAAVDSLAGVLESNDSNQVSLTPKDTFPPAAPQGIVAAVQPGASAANPIVELSWSINVEPDLAGYRVYRSEKEGDRGPLLNSDLLPSPAYRDRGARPGQQYWYTVTAVDRAGNESAPSSQVAVDVAQPSR
jgi:hypothetical protein